MIAAGAALGGVNSDLDAIINAPPWNVTKSLFTNFTQLWPGRHLRPPLRGGDLEI